MKNISPIIQYLFGREDFYSQKLYEAFKQTNENQIELLNRIRNIEKRNLQYFANVKNSAVQALANAAVVNFDTTVYPQFGNMHDNTVENSRIYIRRSGVYCISGGVQFNASAAGTFRGINIRLTRDGVTTAIVGQYIPSMNGTLILNGSRSYYLYTDDYIDMAVTHDAGAPIDISNVDKTFLSVSERMEELDKNDYGSMLPEEHMR